MDTKTMGIVRYAAWALVAVVALATLAVGLGWIATGSGPPRQGDPLVQPFQLIDQEGRAVSERDVLGRPAALFFGFVYCPDVCPTTLASMTGWLQKLGPDAEKLGVFFVTVDPQRDTPTELKAYLASFDPRIRGLTGSPEAVAAVQKTFGIYSKRVDIEGGGYTMDHTASVILVDAQGRFAGTIGYGESGEVALAKLKRLASGG